ncbi:MAG TPA: MarR family transcriptional regulator [Gemmatimonadales bacterium]|nr:MarR family transcriptional regulator [Gemmatimonadales bacterium]
MTSQLQSELKQHRPFESLEAEASLSILRTAAEMEYQTSEVLKSHGLTITQYNALRILRGAGEQGLCRNEVRDRLIARVPDATRLLDRLEEMGLVIRSREGEDRRFVLTRITKAGHDLLDQLAEPVAALHREQLGHVGAEKLQNLVDLLGEVRRKCRG